MLSAVFLDRDGVVNRKAAEGEYVTSWECFEFIPGALEAIARLARGSAPIVIATNQRGIARGCMSEQTLDDIHARMLAAIESHGGRIDEVRYCPHEVGCRCRKPETGMFEDAATALGFSIAGAAVIGDAESDMEAARRIGALQVRIARADSPVAAAGEDHRAEDLGGAVEWLADTRRIG